MRRDAIFIVGLFGAIELELLPGLRLVPAPGHTRGMQVVVVEIGGRPVVIGGDVAVWFGELDEPHTEGEVRVRALDPELVWLTHEHEPYELRGSRTVLRERGGATPPRHSPRPSPFRYTSFRIAR